MESASALISAEMPAFLIPPCCLASSPLLILSMYLSLLLLSSAAQKKEDLIDPDKHYLILSQAALSSDPDNVAKTRTGMAFLIVQNTPLMYEELRALGHFSREGSMLLAVA